MTDEIEITMSDAMFSGITSMGIVALIVGIVILALCTKAVLDGNTPIAILLGFTLVTLVSPVAGLVLVIVAILLTALMGTLPLSGYAIGGWVIGIVLMTIVLAGVGAIVAVTA